jgi:hypothetical protein
MGTAASIGMKTPAQISVVFIKGLDLQNFLHPLRPHEANPSKYFIHRTGFIHSKVIEFLPFGKTFFSARMTLNFAQCMD